MELARTKGPPVTRHWMADGPGPADLAGLLYIMLAFFEHFSEAKSIIEAL